MLQESCTAKGLDVQSVVLLATVPIVPVPIQLNHTVGYILGPVLAVLAIFAFFGTLFFLHLEKERDLRASRGQKPKTSLAFFTAQFWRDAFSPAVRRQRAEARAARQAEARAAKEAKQAELAAQKMKVSTPAAALAAGLAAAEQVSPLEERRARLPKLSLPGARRTSGVQTPKERTTPDRTPRSPGVLYVDNI